MNGKNTRVYSGYELLSEDAIPEVAQYEKKCRLCQRSKSQTTLVLLPKTGEYLCDYDNSDECNAKEKELFMASESLETRTLAASNPSAPAMQNGLDVVFTESENLALAQYLDAMHWTLDWEVVNDVNDVRVPIIPEWTPDWQPKTSIEYWALYGVTKLISHALSRHKRLKEIWVAKYDKNMAFLQACQQEMLNYRFPFDAVVLENGAAQPALSNGLADNEGSAELPARNGAIQDPLTPRDA